MKQDKIVIYKAKDGDVHLDVQMRAETVWLSLDQMSKLFQRDKSVVSRHISNIFKEKELSKISVVANFATTAADQKTYQVDYYNLDVIISVGYRVKSKQGVRFRQWATRILNEHLLKGYTLNQKRLEQKTEAFRGAQRALTLLQNVVEHRNLTQDETRGLLQVIQDYTHALELLDQYDHGKLKIDQTHPKAKFAVTYKIARDAIQTLAQAQPKTSSLFGKEKDASLKSSLAAIYQTSGKRDLYPSIEEKAAHLLYFVVKNHSFVDGNKRIAAFLFLLYLERNGCLYRPSGEKRVADNALVALTLLIAESKPSEKDTTIKVIINLINKKN